MENWPFSIPPTTSVCLSGPSYETSTLTNHHLPLKDCVNASFVKSRLLARRSDCESVNELREAKDGVGSGWKLKFKTVIAWTGKPLISRDKNWGILALLLIENMFMNNMKRKVLEPD